MCKENIMSILAERLSKIAPSPTVAMTTKANALKAEGKDIIGLAAGEPDFDTPANIAEAGIQAIKNGKTRYAPPSGIIELRREIVAKFKRDNDLTYTPEQINVGVGGKQTIFNLFCATLNEGDEIIVPAPYWVSYPDIALLFGGVPTYVECGIENDFKMTPQQLENAITPKTKWLILNSPSNPTGTGYSQEDLKALGEVLKKHPHVYILSDDIYEFLVYDDFEFKTIAQVNPELYDRTMTLNGVSKAYCMTGWRLGYAAGPLHIIKAMNMLNSQSTSSASTMVQWAAVEALKGDKSFIAEHNKKFVERRNKVLELLRDIDGIECAKPAGAFYLYPCIKGLIGKKTPDGTVIETDQDFVTYILESKGVVAVQGSAFGLSPYFRISYASSLDTLTDAMGRIKQAVDALV